MVNKFFFLSLYHRERNWRACMEHSHRNGTVCHQTSHIRWWWWWWWLDEDECRQYVTVVVITAEHCNELGCWATVQRVAVVIVTEQCSDFCYEISLSLAVQPVHLLQSYNQTPIQHTYTHPFNGPFSGSTQVSQYQKGKPIWILLKQETVSGSGISWAICKSALHSR